MILKYSLRFFSSNKYINKASDLSALFRQPLQQVIHFSSSIFHYVCKIFEFLTELNPESHSSGM